MLPPNERGRPRDGAPSHGNSNDLTCGDSTPLEAAARAIHALETQAWREQRDRHKDFWSMPTHERLTVLTYDAGFGDGYEQAVADIAAAWANRSYWTGGEVTAETIARLWLGDAS